jgi:hypothetical protein
MLAYVHVVLVWTNSTLVLRLAPLSFIFIALVAVLLVPKQQAVIEQPFQVPNMPLQRCSFANCNVPSHATHLPSYTLKNKEHTRICLASQMLHACLVQKVAVNKRTHTLASSHATQVSTHTLNSPDQIRSLHESFCTLLSTTTLLCPHQPINQHPQ